ncbi:MAG: hypothetical protein QXO86_03455 [Nitrososphaerota archaeon]
MRYIDPETGLPLEAAEKLRPRLGKLEIITQTDTGLAVGTREAPATDIVCLNVTIVSSRESKADIRPLSPEEKDIQLPEPKAYKLEDGRILIGFIEDELPRQLRKGGGYSLNEIVAILALKVKELEKKLQR